MHLHSSLPCPAAQPASKEVGAPPSTAAPLQGRRLRRHPGAQQPRPPPHVSCRAQHEDGDTLASQFSSFLLRSEQPPAAPPTPSPLLPPHAVVAAQMEALQRNDYPEADAGLRTAYLFAKPYGAEDFILNQVPSSFSRVRSWGAAEEWLSPEEFASMLNSAPFCTLVDCDSWKAASGIVFTSSLKQNKAVQAVHVMAPPLLYPPPLSTPSPSPDIPDGNQGSGHPSSTSSTSSTRSSGSRGGEKIKGEVQKDIAGIDRGWPFRPTGAFSSSRAVRSSGGTLRQHTFTFCLERIDTGALTGIWYTVGMRVGNYAV